ncbi:MAG: protease SohB [Gammaproteobacteria bacterium]|nr:protease SohB [Gammaproteobacteria bacterium]
MMNFLSAYGLFLLKIATVTIAIILIIITIAAIATKNRFKPKEKIEITKLNEKYQSMKEALNSETLSKSALKTAQKSEKQKEKLQQKAQKSSKQDLPRIFVLDFIGDLKASAVENLREEITAILTVATPKDEVLIKIESPGGVIHSYGLAASQLKRIRERGIPLIAAVDKVAASGGYMMACVADRIIAAPFAIIGSIGVLAQLPNFHRLLKKYNIDFEQFTAGDFKRTVSYFGEITDKGRKKFQQEIEEAHELFKNFVADNRPVVDINSLATGEYWHGTRAKELRLVDELVTSDDYLLKANTKANLYQISYVIKKPWNEKFGNTFSKTLEKILLQR